MEVRGTLYILKDIREYGVKANLAQEEIGQLIDGLAPSRSGLTPHKSETKLLL